MGPFSRKHDDEPENVAAGGPDGAFGVVNAAGKRLRYTAADFDEIFTTTESREMRQHVEIGWLLLDEWVGVTRDGPLRGSTPAFAAAPAACCPLRTTRSTYRRAT